MSLGMCARHTRGLMSQPGAARRLTAVYRYLIREARDRLTGRAARPGSCPACEHDDGAAGRALDTLLEGLADDLVRDRCRELGGLCIPHVRAASARGDHRTVAWLAQMTASACARPARPGWLAGTDHDADTRAVLRGALPATALPRSGACAACLAAARSEASHLVQIARGSDRSGIRRCCWPGRLGRLIVPHQPAKAVTAGLAGQENWLPASDMAVFTPPHHDQRAAASPRAAAGAGLGACPVCTGRRGSAPAG